MLTAVACSSDGPAAPSATTQLPTAQFEIAPGVLARYATPPELPGQAIALSDFLVFEAQVDSPLVVGFPLTEPQMETTEVGFYSVENGVWSGIIGAISLEEDGTVLQAVLPSVPPNAIVLRFPADATLP